MTKSRPAPPLPAVAARFLGENDPALLADDSGRIVWHNAACAGIFPKLAAAPDSTLRDLLGDPWRDVIETVHYQILDLKLEAGKFTGIVIDSPAESLDQSLYLLAIKPAGDRALYAQEAKEFLAVVSHDLKNPLSALFGYADVLLDTGYGEGLSEQQREVIISIRQIARRSIEFVRNCEYLSLAPIRDGSLPVFHTDVNEVLQTVVDNLIREGDKTPAIEAALAPQPVRTSAHPTQIERVASNLLSNALKYTPLSERIVIRSWSDQQGPAFSVHNSGVAIPAGEQQNIFERHVRGSTSAGTPGSGLGLYIVKKILRAIGGSVELESAPKTGTTFTVRLPRGN